MKLLDFLSIVEIGLMGLGDSVNPVERYDEIQRKILTKFKNKVNNYLTFSNIISYTSFAKRLNPYKKAKIDIKGTPENIQIKEVDWKFLEKLKNNSKTSIVELSKELNIGERIVIRKINMLKKKGIIQRFYPWLDTKKLGYDEYTFISRIDPSYSREIDEFIKFTKSDSRFLMAIKAVGYVNLSYSFIVKDDEELKEILAKREEILGKARLKSFKIEINDMVG